MRYQGLYFLSFNSTKLVPNRRTARLNFLLFWLLIADSTNCLVQVHSYRNQREYASFIKEPFSPPASSHSSSDVKTFGLCHLFQINCQGCCAGETQQVEVGLFSTSSGKKEKWVHLQKSTIKKKKKNTLHAPPPCSTSIVLHANAARCIGAAWGCLQGTITHLLNVLLCLICCCKLQLIFVFRELPKGNHRVQPAAGRPRGGVTVKHVNMVLWSFKSKPQNAF